MTCDIIVVTTSRGGEGGIEEEGGMGVEEGEGLRSRGKWREESQSMG